MTTMEQTTTVERTGTAQQTGTAAPPPAGRRRKILSWLFIAALVVGVTFVAMRVAVQMPSVHSALDPGGRGPWGTMAIAEILRAQGVEVTATDSRARAASLLGPDATLVLAEPPALSDSALQELVAASDEVVFVSASARTLRLFDLGDDAFAHADAATASCDWAPFSRVGTIAPDRLFTPAAGVTGCFTDAEGHAAVLVAERDGPRISLVEATALFSNDHLAEGGNAALALALIGQHERVVWYVPTPGDTDFTVTGPDTLGSLTPEWVTPAIVLVLLTVLAAAVWRGRRFGPLVEETLPVTVRASETMHGRAKLTARAADSAHAAEALRSGSLTRLAKRLGLGERVAASAVANAAADRLHAPRAALQHLLCGELPHSDSDLIDFARQLDDLENALDRAVHTERTTP